MTWYFVKDALGGQKGDLTGSRRNEKVVAFLHFTSAESSRQLALVMGEKQGIVTMGQSAMTSVLLHLPKHLHHSIP